MLIALTLVVGNDNMARSPNRKEESGTRKNSSPNAKAAGQVPGPEAKDRPGFDLGGAVTDETGGSGLGLGDDAAENRDERRLPRQQPTIKPAASRDGE